MPKPSVNDRLREENALLNSIARAALLKSGKITLTEEFMKSITGKRINLDQADAKVFELTVDLEDA